MLVPIRKCYQIIKLAAIMIIVVGVLSMFEHWRGGKRNVVAEDFTDPEEEFFERQIREDEARIIPGLGAGGEPVTLTGQDKILGKQSEQKLAMNVYLSDRIPYNRTLKDYRNPMCQRVIYDAELPSASVIIIFHNEPYSVVVRTLWSVINSARRDQPWYQKANYIDRKTGKKMRLGYPGQDPSSQFIYLKEIILVDDNSTLPELQGKLSHYIRTRLPPDLIRILRLPERVGLTQARLRGAKTATQSILIFLDAHCEVMIDWLRPILQTIKENRTVVVTPLIDNLLQDTFEYQYGETLSDEYQVLLQVFEFFRIGLTRARLAGAKFATGSAMVFLDAHCEVQPDWLRPMLQRIKDAPHAVIVPIIDVINRNDFYYSVQSNAHFQYENTATENPMKMFVGGFSFTGHFTWIDVPEREKVRRGSDIAPTWSPTMAGGLFAMDRSYYWELGAYDEQMNGWGGENLEISFRIWQCGGTLETVPCSRVGHVFRSFHPYSLPASSDTHGINTARMAEVWMDDYKELFYLHRPDLRKSNKIGDITHRKVLREKLRCKPFQWFLDNIYREKFVPVRDATAYGRVLNPASNLCLDTLQQEAERSPLGVYSCHETLQATQYFSLSTAGELRDEEKCAEVLYTADEKKVNDARKVLMSTCTGKGQSQKWRHLEGGYLQHVESGLCMASGWKSGENVWARSCTSAPDMKWIIDFNRENDYKGGNLFSAEQEETLRRLRGQRRVPRSLPAPPPRPPHSHRRHRSHRRKNKHSRRIKRKNKFILRVERVHPEGNIEHLEMELLCRHRRLYPNDTFVKDIVNLLNDNNIRVINNGRVFERHESLHSRTTATPEMLPPVIRERHFSQNQVNADSFMIPYRTVTHTPRTTYSVSNVAAAQDTYNRPANEVAWNTNNFKVEDFQSQRATPGVYLTSPPIVPKLRKRKKATRTRVTVNKQKSEPPAASRQLPVVAPAELYDRMGISQPNEEKQTQYLVEQQRAEVTIGYRTELPVLPIGPERVSKKSKPKDRIPLDMSLYAAKYESAVRSKSHKREKHDRTKHKFERDEFNETQINGPRYNGIEEKLPQYNRAEEIKPQHNKRIEKPGFNVEVQPNYNNMIADKQKQPKVPMRENQAGYNNNRIQDAEYYDDESDTFSDVDFHSKIQTYAPVSKLLPIFPIEDTGRRRSNVVDKSQVTWSPDEAVRLVLRSNLTFNLGDDFFTNLQLAGQHEGTTNNTSKLSLQRVSIEVTESSAQDNNTKEPAKDKSISSVEDSSSYSDTHEID